MRTTRAQEQGALKASLKYKQGISCSFDTAIPRWHASWLTYITAQTLASKIRRRGGSAEMKQMDLSVEERAGIRLQLYLMLAITRV